MALQPLPPPIIAVFNSPTPLGKRKVLNAPFVSYDTIIVGFEKEREMEKILITGAAGYIGSCLAKYLSASFKVTASYFRKSPPCIPNVEWKKLDITEDKNVGEVFKETIPDVVIHCSAVASVAECENEPSWAEKVNVVGTNYIAKACDKVGAYMVFLSTDMVFDGKGAPYSEFAVPSPLSVYGKTKLEAEKLCLPDALVLRLSLCYGYGVGGGKSFLENAIEKMKQGGRAVFFYDEWRSPLWIWDLTKAVSRIVKSRPRGILHLGGMERMSRFEMAQRACKIYGIDSSLLEAASRLGMSGPYRPEDLSLDSSKFRRFFPDFSFTDFEKALSSGGGD